MSASGLSERDLAELAAFADGTLPAERRAQLEARIAASPELAELVGRQRRSLAAMRSAADEPVPASLAAAVEASRVDAVSRRGRGRRRVALRLGAVAALVAVAATVLVLNLGGSAAQMVADAARFAAEAPRGPTPPRLGTRTARSSLSPSRAWCFPTSRSPFGWRAFGVRSGRIGGRNATAVSYGNGGRRGRGYVIVAGPALAQPAAGQATTIGGVQYQTLQLNGELAVTWRREGHTCVLTGAATWPELLALASWGDGMSCRPTGRRGGALFVALEPARQAVAARNSRLAHRAFGHTPGLRGFLIGQAGEIDRHERVAELVGQLGDRGVHLIDLERRCGVVRRRCGEGQVIGKRRGIAGRRLAPRAGSPAYCATPAQIAQLILAGEKTRPREHARTGLLHQVLGILARSGPGACGAVETRQVLHHTIGVKSSWSSHSRWPRPSARAVSCRPPVRHRRTRRHCV